MGVLMISLRFLLTLVFLLEINSSMAEDLCRQGEQVIFSCVLKKRTASLCASAPFAKDQGYVQYRFGKKLHIEFQVPSNPSPQGKDFYLSSATYGGGGETHLRFMNKTYEYIIYERTTKGEEDSQGVRPTLFEDGVFVKQFGKKIAQYRCDKKSNTGISAIAYEAFSIEPFGGLLK